MGIFPSQGNTILHICLIDNNTPNSWESSLHRGTQRSISVLERNNTPISWAHPTHGISHMLTHSVCVLEDVSCNCNHQQHSFIMVSLAEVTKNLSAGNSKELIARKTTNKPTTSTYCYMQLAQESTLQA
jgi:hypothetical protein